MSYRGGRNDGNGYGYGNGYSNGYGGNQYNNWNSPAAAQDTTVTSSTTSTLQVVQQITQTQTQTTLVTQPRAAAAAASTSTASPDTSSNTMTTTTTAYGPPPFITNWPGFSNIPSSVLSHYQSQWSRIPSDSTVTTTVGSQIVTVTGTAQTSVNGTASGTGIQTGTDSATSSALTGGAVSSNNNNGNANNSGSSSNSGGENRTGLIAGLVVALIVVFILVGAIIFFWRRNRRIAALNRNQPNDYAAHHGPASAVSEIDSRSLGTSHRSLLGGARSIAASSDHHSAGGMRSPPPGYDFENAQVLHEAKGSEHIPQLLDGRSINTRHQIDGHPVLPNNHGFPAVIHELPGDEGTVSDHKIRSMYVPASPAQSTLVEAYVNAGMQGLRGSSDKSLTLRPRSPSATHPAFREGQIDEKRETDAGQQLAVGSYPMGDFKPDSHESQSNAYPNMPNAPVKGATRSSQNIISPISNSSRSGERSSSTRISSTNSSGGQRRQSWISSLFQSRHANGNRSSVEGSWVTESDNVRDSMHSQADNNV